MTALGVIVARLGLVGLRRLLGEAQRLLQVAQHLCLLRLDQREAVVQGRQVRKRQVEVGVKAEVHYLSEVGRIQVRYHMV